MKKLLILIFVLFLSSFASAHTSLVIDLDDRGDAIFLGTSTDNITLPDGVSINQGKISGITSSLTSKSGDLWEFSFALPNSKLSIYLPQGALIKNVSEGEISIIENQISILSEGRITVNYEINQTTTNSSYTNYIIIIIIICFIIALAYYLNGKKKTPIPAEKKPDKFNIIKKVLNEREKLILENLKKAGKIKMSHLRKITEIPKASFSRHIQELEKKKLIRRTGEGKNKFVELISA